jgi:hypothetical protein
MVSTMLIKFIATNKKGESVHAVRLYTKLETIKIKDRRKNLETHGVQWIVFEKGKNTFLTEKQFQSTYDVYDLKVSCAPICTHLEIHRSAKDWHVHSKKIMYRCIECGAWYTAEKG